MHYNYRDYEKQGKHKNLKRLIVLVVFLGFIYVLFQVLKPWPKPTFSLTLQNSQIPGNFNINWPTDIKYGVVGTLQSGIISKTKDQGKWPLASVAKIMTAYIILRDHPLKIGEDGPSFTITSEEVQEYNTFKQDGQSVVKVALGEKLTERQLLEGLMVPSANNFAYILAKWDAGSVKAFIDKMNKTAKELGLKGTYYTDPSGANKATVSTPEDQFKLAALAMQIPIFRHITAMPQVNLPIAGIQYNVNYDLGKDNIIGIKTGSSLPAKANFVFDSVQNNIDIIGVIFGAQGKSALMTALKDAISIINITKNQVFWQPLIKQNQVVGYIRTLWSKENINLLASKDVSVVAYPGMKIQYSLIIDKNLKFPLKQNEQIGYLVIKHGDSSSKIPLIVSQDINPPSFLDRFKRIL